VSEFVPALLPMGSKPGQLAKWEEEHEMKPNDNVQLGRNAD